MRTVTDCIGSLPPRNINEGLTDLDSVKRQIRIARLKLGSVLDALDRAEASPFQIYSLLENVGQVTTAVDHLVDSLPTNRD
jgi:hypothetical protein